MNKLELYSGGHPRSNDDLSFIQDAYKEGFAAILSLFHKDSVTTGIVLQGCGTAVAGPNFTWTEGYIGFQGEIFKVDAGSVVLSGLNYSWYIIPEGAYSVDAPATAFDNYTIASPSPVTYQDLVTTHNVHQVRKMALKVGLPAANEISAASILRFPNAYAGGGYPDVSLLTAITDFAKMRTRFIEASNEQTGGISCTSLATLHTLTPSSTKSASTMKYTFNGEFVTGGSANAADYVTIWLYVNGVIKKTIRQSTGIATNYVTISLEWTGNYTAGNVILIKADNGGTRALTCNNSILICHGDSLN